MKEKIVKFVDNILPLNCHAVAFDSLNGMDCNSGAVYDYMIRNGYNKKYKIIWIVDDKKKYKHIKIRNVSFISRGNLNIIDRLKLKMTKYLIWDNIPIYKTRKNQVNVYLTHGCPGIKNVKGIINIPEFCDYCLMSSKFVESLNREQFSLSANTKSVFTGLPRNDYLFTKENELKKIITDSDNYEKVILWMPTFRKAKFSVRNDSNKNYKLGIPLVSTIGDLKKLNLYLKNKNILLIIKIHGGQDLSQIKIENDSNIFLVTDDDLKQKNINLYKLISKSDALLTDYSSVAFDYMLLNRPIGYVLDDIKEYKIGFAFKDVLKYMPGSHLYKLDDLYLFIDEVNDNIDRFKNERNKILIKINKFRDDKNSERVFNFIIKGEKRK